MAFIVLSFFSFIITESSSSPFSGQLLATAKQQRNLVTTSTTATSGNGFGGAGIGGGNVGVGIANVAGGGGGNVVNNNTNCFYAATAPITPTANLPINANSVATAATAVIPLATAATIIPPATAAVNTTTISPTFIEHKYSANTFREKLFANLRQQNLNKLNNNNSNNNNNNVKTLKTNNSITKTECDGNNLNDEQNSLRSLNVATNEIGIGNENFNNNHNGDVEGSGGDDNDDVINDNVNIHQTTICSTIQQQLTENFKNNLYKKTIN